MTADELRTLLAPYGVRPIRDRGQHFLLDDRVVAAMADAAGVAPGVCVVEVGPGPGILTRELLSRGARVLAVELDLKLAKLLQDRFGGEPRFTLVQGDVLGVPNETLAASCGGGGYRVVANLPYAITSDALRKFLLASPWPDSMTVMIQREVADRILAPAGEMSAIAVLVRTLGDVRRVVNVPAGSFFPPPRVDSTVIHIARKSLAELDRFFGEVSPERHFAIVRAAFAGKRKQLKNSLKGSGIDENRLTKAFSRSGVRPDARPETLTVEDWRRLVHELTDEGNL